MYSMIFKAIWKDTQQQHLFVAKYENVIIRYGYYYLPSTYTFIYAHLLWFYNICTFK